MDSLVASRAWPARVANTTLKDLDRELDQIKNDVADLERWRDRFYEAIHQGFVINVRNVIMLVSTPHTLSYRYAFY